jgi:hypothetical protein
MTVIATQTDDPSIHATTVQNFYKLPRRGGKLTLLAHLPGGPFEVDDNTIYLGTSFGGDVYAIRLDPGQPRLLARHVADEIHGLAVVDGAIIVVGLDRNVDATLPGRVRVVRVDRMSGDVSDVPPNGVEHIRRGLMEVRRGGVTYMTSSEGATVRVRRNGAVDVIPSPQGFTPCFAADSTTLFWIQEDVMITPGDHPSLPSLYSAPITGGPMTKLPEAGTLNVANELDCVANDDTLFFMKGKDIASRGRDGTIRTVAATRDLTTMYVDQEQLMWADRLSEGSYTIRAISLH